MKDQTLQAIDQSVANFLQDYASDEIKRECLKAFVESKEIVKWISEEITGHFIHYSYIVTLHCTYCYFVGDIKGTAPPKNHVI